MTFLTSPGNYFNFNFTLSEGATFWLLQNIFGEKNIESKRFK